MDFMKNNLQKNCSPPVGLVWVFALLAMLCVTSAKANFVGDFAPSQWTLQPDQGQTYFANSSTELHIVGPTGNFYPSDDMVSILGPTAGLGQRWLLSFHWNFNAGGSESVEADISTGGNPYVFASGGSGASVSGDYSFTLNQGDTAYFFLSSDTTGAGKQAPSFVISGFNFTPYAAPDVTPWIDFALVLPLFGRRFMSVIRR